MIKIKLWLLVLLWGYLSVYTISAQAETLKGRLLLAKTAINNKQLDDAEAYIRQAVESINRQTEKTLKAEAHYWLGVIMEKQAEASSIFSIRAYGKESQKAFLKSVELEPENILYRQALINFYLDAPSFAGGDIDLAIKHAKVIFGQDPNAGYIALIDSYTKDDEAELVLHTYQEAMKSFPVDATFAFKRGVYWWLNHQYEKSVSDLELALSYPDTGEDQKLVKLWCWYYIGRISLTTEIKLERGIKAYQNFINDYDDMNEGAIPSLEWVRFNMANLLMLNRQKKKAKIIYQELLVITTDKNLIEALNDKI